MNKSRQFEAHPKKEKKERSFSEFTRDKLESDYNPTIRKHSMFPGLKQKSKKYSLSLQQQEQIKTEIVQKIRSGKQIKLDFSDIDTFRFTNKKFYNFPFINNSAIEQINQQQNSKQKYHKKKFQKISENKMIQALLQKVLNKNYQGNNFLRQNTCGSSNNTIKSSFSPDNLMRSNTQQINLTNSIIGVESPFQKTQKEKYQALISKVSGKIRIAKAFKAISPHKRSQIHKTHTEPSFNQTTQLPIPIQKNRRERVLDAQRQILQKSNLTALKDSLQEVFHEIRSAFPFKEQSSPKLIINSFLKDEQKSKIIQFN